MKIAALIGYPLAHSITPAMYAPAFDARCEKWVTASEDLRRCVERLRGPEMLGANVTVPHKEAVIPLLERLDAGARRIGAVNCIVRERDGTLTGHNTDKYGFICSLREGGFEPEGHRALLLGAGGAARAVALGLAEAGCRLTISNRTAERARALAADFGGVDVVEWHGASFADACAIADLIVNSTPMGTAHTEFANQSPVEAKHFRPGACAFDLVYNPLETPFLREAAAAGARVIGGLEMLIYQGAESIRLWTGLEPPIDVMRKAARAALGA